MRNLSKGEEGSMGTILEPFHGNNEGRGHQLTLCFFPRMVRNWLLGLVVAAGTWIEWILALGESDVLRGTDWL